MCYVCCPTDRNTTILLAHLFGQQQRAQTVAHLQSGLLQSGLQLSGKLNQPATGHLQKHTLQSLEKAQSIPQMDCSGVILSQLTQSPASSVVKRLLDMPLKCCVWKGLCKHSKPPTDTGRSDGRQLSSALGVAPKLHRNLVPGKAPETVFSKYKA